MMNNWWNPILLQPETKSVGRWKHSYCLKYDCKIDCDPSLKRLTLNTLTVLNHNTFLNITIPVQEIWVSFEHFLQNVNMNIKDASKGSFFFFSQVV